MPTPTTNMGLNKAIDADNAESYLASSLATSLDVVDAHRHEGTTSGLQIRTAGLAAGACTGATLGSDVVVLTGVQSITGQKTLTSPILTNAIVSDRLIRSGTVATAAAGAQAGAAPPAPIAESAGSPTDLAGGWTFGTGTGPAAGAQIAVTFHAAYTGTNPPAVLAAWASVSTMQAMGDMAVTVQGVAGAWTGFTVHSEKAPAASQGNTTYGMRYIVIGA